MADSRLLLVCAVTVLVTAFSHAEPAPDILGLPSGTYSEAQVLIPGSFTPGSVAQYRFSGRETWFPFDRPLYLDAFAGEERSYTIELRSSDGTRHTSVSYLIDRRPPEPPVLQPSSGDIEGSLSLLVEGNGDLFISTDGSSFQPVADNGEFVFSAEPDATRIVSATAYAVDPAGNASRFSSARWRLHPSGLVPSYPFPDELGGNTITPLLSSAEISAELVDLVGSARFTVKVPDGVVPCVAINAADPFTSSASYVELSGASGGTCLIPFPWGDDTEIVVHYGYKRDGVRYIVSEPVRLIPRFPAEAAEGVPSQPVPPTIRIYEATAFVDWPATPWAIMYSLGTGEFETFEQPILFQLGPNPVAVRFYMLDRSGDRSDTASIELPARFKSAAPEVFGVENGKTYGGRVTLTSQGVAKLRYEIVEGDAPPPPVTGNSPAMNQDGLSFEGKPGESVRYQLRIVSEEQEQPARMITSIPQERFLSFMIDRQPPQVPQAQQGLKSFSSADSILSFKPQSGTILVSISEDGQGKFLDYTDPLTISGSDEGRKRYIIRAFAEDEFGNRSKEMPRMDILIDRSSLYVDSKGHPGASGSPDDPIQYLDDAIEAAQIAGKRFVYVRGTTALRRTVVVSRPLSIAGGFDAEWNESPGSGSISIHIPPSSSSWAFVVDGGSLALSSLSISMTGQGSGGMLFSRSGSISVSNSSLTMSGGIDMTVIRSNSNEIKVHATAIKLTGSVTARGIEANEAILKLTDSTLECDATVKLFDAIRIRDTDAIISGFKLEASPSQALSVISSIRATVNVERAVLSITGGTSSCRVFSANAATLTVSSVYLTTAWKGSSETFNVLNGSRLKVAHLTAIVDAPRSVFISSMGSKLEVYNSIVSFTGSDSVFIRSDIVPGNGSVSSNCLWGFSKYLDGVRSISALAELNRLVNPPGLNFSEDPSRTFTGTIKGLFKLSKSSACRDGGSVVSWASGHDVLGKQRGTPEDQKPDIGAEEL